MMLRSPYTACFSQFMLLKCLHTATLVGSNAPELAAEGCPVTMMVCSPYTACFSHFMLLKCLHTATLVGSNTPELATEGRAMTMMVRGPYTAYRAAACSLPVFPAPFPG
eukprot:1103477-Pelagomonas_calceolata.AAC.6